MQIDRRIPFEVYLSSSFKALSLTYTVIKEAGNMNHFLCIIFKIN